MKTPPPSSPPRLGYGLLSLILKRGEHWGLVGDFDELYAEKASEKGLAAARFWYWGQIAKFAPAYLFNAILWSGDMFRNHMIVAWRNIKKRKAYSALNILGLAVGMAVFILIMLFVRTELSFDGYHANSKNIHRILKEDPGWDYLGSNIFAPVPAPLAPALIQAFPEIQAATRIYDSSDVLISIGEKNFLEKTLHWTDPQTFEIFSFPLIRGDTTAVLRDPFSLLLSEKAARRFFGEADPIGRTITYHISEKAFDFTVTGVFRDIPANSHFVMDIVAPVESLAKMGTMPLPLTDWNNRSFYTYVLLKDGADAKALDLKFPAFMDKFAGNNLHQEQGRKPRFFLQSLARIHLFSQANFELSPPGDIRTVFLFASIAVLVLLIAGINYMNLATAQSIKRVKEIGLRKVVGAAKGQIVRQFLGDSLVLTFLALLLAVAGVLAVLPAFCSFVERDIVFSPLRDAALIPGLILLVAAVGTISGSYPAFFVAAFRPVSALKGTGSTKSKGRALRNTLIVFQFTASIALIICTIGVRSQLRFIRNRDMGYQREQILVLEPRGGIRADLEAFKTELKQNPAIRSAAMSSGLPDNVRESMYAAWPGKPESVSLPIYAVRTDYDFVDLFGLSLVQGRNFSREFASDVGGAYLINESAQKALGWTDPVGREFGRGSAWQPLGKIVGVIKDFHGQSLHLPITPLYILLKPGIASYLSIKIRETDIPATLAFVREAWKRFAPEYPFEYSFFDEIFDKAYRAEQRLGKIFSVFSGLAVLIACLGLVGLAAFTADQKTKEIGIRKVLGASSAGIMAMISRSFMKWVVLANLIAWPVGYFAMRAWLQNFAYRISLTVPMFLGAALAAFAIAAAVISLQTYRAATANPADSIRCE